MEQRQPANLGTVSQCSVASCTYSEQQQCIAGGIYVTEVERQARCSTYTDESVAVEEEHQETGNVFQCNVIDCTYNEGQECIAESVTISWVEEVPLCETYTS